jgi:16S rRNA (cytidine1402-2'-O)-methyltransferase
MHANAATLWLVATPIGNLDDLAPRAASVLREVAVVACEDTRHSAPLLARIGSHASLFALHEHNEREATPKLVARLSGGESIALISDAGTPLISDPGYRLVGAAQAAGIRVSPVPGPCAAIAALSVAGLPTDRFVFEGFLPARGGPRTARLAELAGETRTLVFYEARHRIVETLADCVAAFGATRRATVARDAEQQLGEFVLVVAGADPVDADGARLAEGRKVYALLAESLPASQAAKLASRITGAPRNALYGGQGPKDD